MRSLLQIFSFVVLVLSLAACGSSGGADSSTSGGIQASSVCNPVIGSLLQATDGEAGGRPKTIPALRAWRSDAGAYEFTDQSKIIVGSAALQPVAEVFAADLFELTGQAVPIVSGAGPSAGDILLDLGPCDPRIGHEGYGLLIGQSIEIQAADHAGVFYGTRSVLQLLRQDSRIAAGQALDWPRYPERGFMIDVGRKYFTAEWIRRHIKEAAWLKMNLYHFHFSENEGFRVESASHPEIVSEAHLTKDEVREIVALASRYFITVIPEIGMPSHMGAALAPHPEYQLTDIFGQPATNNLDVSNPEAVQFARELIEEYLPLFPGPYWHTGGDEYIASYDYARYPQLQAYAQSQYGPGANGKDAVHGHLNWVADLVAGHGKQTRVWNDDLSGGSAVTLNPDIVVEWWTDFQPLGDIVLIPTPQELLDRGHRIHNASNWPTYLTPGGPSMFQIPPDMASAYESWDVHQFSGALYSGPIHLPYKSVAPDEPHNLGTKFHLWANDEFGTLGNQDEIADDIVPRLQLIAQKGWQSPRLTASYAEFQSTKDAIGHAPGY